MDWRDDSVGGLAGDVGLEMLLFLVAIALGETARLTILTGRETAPMSTAAALGLSFTALTAPGDQQVDASVVVATISLGMACGLLILRLATGSGHWGGTAARLLAAASAAVRLPLGRLRRPHPGRVAGGAGPTTAGWWRS